MFMFSNIKLNDIKNNLYRKDKGEPKANDSAANAYKCVDVDAKNLHK